MRHANAGRRSRNRNNHNNNNNNGRRGGAPNKMQVFDSNGPDVRIRGTAYQICERYLTLAKDAASTNDMILAESYLQHAEHYQRLINTWAEQERNDPAYMQRHHHMPEPRPEGQPAGERSQSDDLALPTSILGFAPQASPQPQAEAVRSAAIQARESEMQDA